MLATAVDHPRLTKTDAASIRAALRDFNQYSNKLSERAPQLVGDGVTSTEFSKAVQLKLCVSSDWIESVFDLEFNENVTDYDSFSNEALRKYL